MLQTVDNKETSLTKSNTEMQTKAIQAQAAVFMAKQFPRDLHTADSKISNICKSKSLANIALYSYSRGNQIVSGASIRLAETIAQNIGNFQSGATILERGKGWTKVEAWAWDVENNNFASRVFVVDHVRETKKSNTGKIELTSERDITELILNMAARRRRACILELVPFYITENAVAECKKTLSKEFSESPQEQIKKILIKFSEIGVTKKMIDNYLKHDIELINEEEIINLRGIYNAISSGTKSREDYFVFEETKTSKLNNAIAAEIVEVSHAN